MFRGISEIVLFLTGMVSSSIRQRPRLLDTVECLNMVFRVAWQPVVIVSIPLGMIFALNFDSMLSLAGLREIASAGLVPALVREIGPLFAGLITATTAGAAFAADIGARRVRDELDASEIMAVSTDSRLFIPRIIALTLGGPVLSVFGTVTAVIGGWVLIVLLRSGSAGTYLNGLEMTLRTGDALLLLCKAAFFGFVTAVAACYSGNRAKGGPTGVADATRRAIIASYSLIVLVAFMFNQFFYGMATGL